jgi:hypothetical protein
VEACSMANVSFPTSLIYHTHISRFHLYMFGALLILAASTLFLITHQDETIPPSIAAKRSETTPTVTEEKLNGILYAIWSASISLGSVLICMTCITLLNRSLDKPRTLIINSRWIRLGLRIPITAVIVCLPLISNLTASRWCGAAVCLLYGMFLFEWVAGLERDWQFLESKKRAEE